MKIRFILNIFPVFLSLFPVFIAGCATSPEKSKQPSLDSAITGLKNDQDPFSGVPERYRLKAREDEKKGDLPKALRGWELVKSFLPNDSEARDEMARLKRQISAAADEHFRRGLSFFETHSYAASRKEFLLTLYLNPDHAQAIQYLKEKLAGEDSLTYEVKRGETIKEVAGKIYEDPQKDYLIAYFNDLKIDAPIEPPMTLKMPVLDPASAARTPVPSKRVPDPSPKIPLDKKEILRKARSSYQEGNYQESAALTGKISEYEPANREIRELKNASYYQWGKQLSREEKYNEALEAFQWVDPGYKDVNLELSRSRKQMAEAHYIKGLKFFIEEEIENAIQEWEITISLEPNHAKAKEDIQNAWNLLHKLEKIN